MPRGIVLRSADVSVFDTIFRQIIAAIAPFIAPIKGLVHLVTKFKETISGIVDKFTDTVQTGAAIADEIRSFTLRPHIKSRVVSLPIAIKHIKELIAAVVNIGDEIKKLWSMFKGKLGDAKSASDELESEVEGVEDIKLGLTRLGPRLAGIGEKLLGWAGVILTIFSDIDEQLDAINALLHDVLTILQDVDMLDGIFLQQKNSRKVLKTDDGSIRIRIGNLHKS